MNGDKRPVHRCGPYVQRQLSGTDRGGSAGTGTDGDGYPPGAVFMEAGKRRTFFYAGSDPFLLDTGLGAIITAVPLRDPESCVQRQLSAVEPPGTH